MLQIVIPDQEFLDPRTSTFVNVRGQKLQLEHSLISLSKWESKHHKPFLTKEAKTKSETIDYVQCMTITQNVDPNLYLYLTSENLSAVQSYIDDSMTATTFPNLPHGGAPSRQIVTSELIYYWMISFGIPFECQKWHLNRLLTLIQVCNVKNTPPKKRSAKEHMEWQRSQNAARRAALNSKG